ncbi:NAD-dependent succinate-semialdehyde dehydrogenase [Pseudonocardia eucalypti]|uniref:NAD-dependent succinate-semialdehyde dehydrogenase n=1 Tax=Pseudonocardia eucalypti TaxID=648755 RepID=A0ABP9QNZ0_9PSEU|nr:succinate-semialdehyde dehydrogenase/glutarate-semialdehyde dehydrogenase [Pseudonocardia eucalypti]
MSADPSATLLVNGEWRAGSGTFEVVDPATTEVIGHAAAATPADARAALDAAWAALPGWRETDAETRGGRLRAAAAAIRERADELAGRLTAENGKPLAEARGEIIGCARMLEWSAEEGRRAYGRVTPPSANGPGLTLLAPVGPVLAITPWNFPASMLVRKVGLALAAGAPVIVKPAEQTPLIATELVRLVNGVGLPPGVLQQLTTPKPAALVAELLVDPRLRKISFTGSTEVGLGLLRATGDRLRRVSLEMGGHSPAIVFADADLEAAARGVVAAKFANAGQSCTAVNRLYVHREVHDELVGRVRELVGGLRLGHGARAGTTVGPLIDLAGLEKVERQVKDAVAKGARVLAGGQRWTPDRAELRGAFYRPTLLADADEGMAVSREETFGPVLPVFAFDDEDAVVDAANRTAYGLAAYVYGENLRRLWRTVERLEFGVIGVNEPAPVRPELPFGGMKNSGQEREGGSEGIEGYLEHKAVAIRI